MHRRSAVAALIVLAVVVGSVARADAQEKPPEPTDAELIERLASGKGSAQQAALDALADRGAAAVPALAAALADERPNVRLFVAYTLKRIGEPARPAVPALVAAIAKNEADVRRMALEAIAAIGIAPEEANEVLLGLLGSEHADVRAGAATMLARRRGEAAPAATRLGDLLVGDPDAAVREAAAQALGAIGEAAPEAIAPLTKRLIERARAAAPDGADASNAARVAAIEALGRLGAGASEAVPVIAPLVEDGDAAIRGTALAALAGIGTDDAVRAIGAALASADAERRRAALGVLLKLGPRAAPARDALVKALDDPDEPIQLRAAQLLGALGSAGAGPEAIAALAKVAGRRSGRLPLVAIAALGEMRASDDVAIAALGVALAEGEVPVRRAAAASLQRIGADAAGAMDALVKALGDESDEVRLSIARTFIAIGEPAAPAIDALIARLQGDRSPAVMGASAQALARIGTGEVVTKLLPLLEHERAAVKSAAAGALREMGPGASAAKEKLVALLRDPDQQVRIAAGTAVLSVAPVEGVREVLVVLETEPHTLRATAAFVLSQARPEGPTVIPALTKALDDSDADVRRHAAMALGNIGPSAAAAADALERLAHDKTQPMAVRTAADAALVAVKGGHR